SLNKMYQYHLSNKNAEAAITSGLSESDIIFKNMIDELSPRNLCKIQQRDYERNIIAVMAFFFEACDIFEEPPANYNCEVTEHA
ncbi:TPA: hypothetical protein ACSP2R_003784, partial [Aeromonas veronii]